MAEHSYKLYSYAFTSKGLSARLAIDKTPPDMYWNLLGLEVRQESSLSSRLGRIPITATSGGTVPAPLPDKNVHTLGRLKGVGTNTWRYAGAGQNIYRITGDAQGAYGLVTAPNEMSGNRFSAATYRPSFSSFPYIFFADSQAMLKDNGTFNPLQQMGIFPPLYPPLVALAGFAAVTVDEFGDYVSLFAGVSNGIVKTYTNLTPNISVGITSIARVGDTVTVTCSAPHGIPVSLSGTVVGGQVVISGVTDPSFNGTYLISTVPTSATFTYTQTIPTNASSSGGTVSCYNAFYSVNTTVSAPSVIPLNALTAVTPASMANILQYRMIRIGGNTSSPSTLAIQSITGTTFTIYNYLHTYASGSYLKITPLYGTVALSTIASIAGIGLSGLDPLFSPGSSTIPGSDSDIVSFFLNLSVVANIASISILFDVGDGSFTQDYYSSTVSLAGFTNNTWGQATVLRGNFTKNGRAGTSGFTWGDVNSYKVVVTTNGSGSCIFQMDSLLMYSPTGLDVGAGSPYDYRYTYFNSNTGDESNGSVPMISNSYVSPNNQSAVLTLTPSTDPQVTNIRIYRRGGSLNVGWTLVAQIPANSTNYVDGASDLSIASESLLALDNDVPVTTTLPVPVSTNLGTAVPGNANATVEPGSMANIYVNQQLVIDQGLNSEEIVIVQSVTPTTFTAYFQASHTPGSTIDGSTRSGHAMNLMTMAFDIAWFAGDPDNPNRLYYSKTTNPEAVPPENWIEIGTPADPIMTVVFYNGQLFVETESRVYRVIIPYPGAVPTPYPTASRHGLIANFAWCLSEGLIPYLSKDGIYIFQGSSSQYASEVIEWLFADKEPNLGPVPEQDPLQAPNTIMAFTKNEFYVSYTDKTGTQRRVAYDLKNPRWRNDDVPATAMFYEEDTDELVMGDQQGMIYRDRRGDYYISPNAGGTAFVNTPINLSLQTGAQDQSFPMNDKSYNELTLDLNCPDPVNVSLLFDDGQSAPLVVATNLVTNGRQRIPFPINAGVGRLSKNVILLISGTVGITGPAHFFDWYIKAAVETEYRVSFDSYWSKQGTDEFKFWKQGWFEYVAPDQAGISFAVYTEGNMATPVFTFVLPQTTVRTSKRVRFPATKGKVWRIVATSPTKFQLYGESFIEFKPVNTASGYAKENLGAMISAQGSV